MSTLEVALVILVVGGVSLFMLALIAACVVMGFYLYRFAKIIMVFEDDILEAKDAADQTTQALNNLLKMPMFFDSPEVKQQVNEALDAVRYLQLRVHGVATRFTERSQQKYTYVDLEPLDNDDQDSEDQS